jgi:hypothetical protein
MLNASSDSFRNDLNSSLILDAPEVEEKPQNCFLVGGGSNTTHHAVKEIRVFVSSTFKDMGIEREQLVKSVFPELKHLCLERGVFFTYVDLRWGITAQDSQDGQTLNLCLNEIDSCRPYFICMLGERYGWHQPACTTYAVSSIMNIHLSILFNASSGSRRCHTY